MSTVRPLLLGLLTLSLVAEADDAATRKAVSRRFRMFNRAEKMTTITPFLAASVDPSAKLSLAAFEQRFNESRRGGRLLLKRYHKVPQETPKRTQRVARVILGSRGAPVFRAVEETFQWRLIKGTPYIDGYELREVTAEMARETRAKIKKHTAAYMDKSRRLGHRHHSALGVIMDCLAGGAFEEGLIPAEFLYEGLKDDKESTEREVLYGLMHQTLLYWHPPPSKHEFFEQLLNIRIGDEVVGPLPPAAAAPSAAEQRQQWARQATMARMQVVGDSLLFYARAHERNFPDSLGMAGLGELFGQTLELQVRDLVHFAAPEAAKLSGVTDASATIVYLGAGLRDRDYIIPILAQRPGLDPKGTPVFCLFGGAKMVPGQFSTLEEVILAWLKPPAQQLYAKNPSTLKLLANARAMDAKLAKLPLPKFDPAVEAYQETVRQEVRTRLEKVAGPLRRYRKKKGVYPGEGHLLDRSLRAAGFLQRTDPNPLIHPATEYMFRYVDRLERRGQRWYETLFQVADDMREARVPLIVERAGADPDGQHVLFSDGSVEFVRGWNGGYTDLMLRLRQDANWPDEVTRAIFDRAKELDRWPR